MRAGGKAPQPEMTSRIGPAGTLRVHSDPGARDRAAGFRIAKDSQPVPGNRASGHLELGVLNVLLLARNFRRHSRRELRTLTTAHAKSDYRVDTDAGNKDRVGESCTGNVTFGRADR